MEVEAEHIAMFANKKCDVMILHKLINKMFNDSTTLVRDDVAGNLIEALWNFIMIKESDHG